MQSVSNTGTSYSPRKPGLVLLVKDIKTALAKLASMASKR